MGNVSSAWKIMHCNPSSIFVTVHFFSFLGLFLFHYLKFINHCFAFFAAASLLLSDFRYLFADSLCLWVSTHDWTGGNCSVLHAEEALEGLSPVKYHIFKVCAIASSLLILSYHCPMQGSGFFVGGFVLVIIGWSIIGMILETYGFWLLFSTFFPTLLGFLRKVPMLNKILDLPVLKTVGPLT